MSDCGKGEFWAFLTGVLTGGIIALLYAPAKGEETRERLRETAAEFKEKGEGLAAQTKGEAEKLFEAGRHKVEETGHKLDDARHKGTEKLREATQKGREKIEEIKSRISHKEEPEETAEETS